MNIFYLDSDPVLSVSYYVDRHVPKMILEYAQLLSTTVRECDGVPQGSSGKLKLLPGETPDSLLYYKSTHVNHPCAIWTRQSLSNWCYLKYLASDLNNEWQYRFKHFDRNHKSYDMILTLPIPQNIPNIPFTPPPSCMDKSYIISNDPVVNYRNYYKKGKTHLHVWTNRPVPEWFERNNP